MAWIPRTCTRVDAPDETLEWQLFDAGRLIDLSLRRCATPTGERIVAYAVPQPDADLGVLRRWLTARALRLGQAVLPAFVDRLPRTASGAVDDAALAAVPVIETGRLHQHARELRIALGVKDVAVRFERASPATAARSHPPSAIARGERLAHAIGPPVAPAPSAPRLTEALIAAARRHPRHGVVAYDLGGAATTIAYPDLLARGLRLARGLHDAGLRPGEVALVQLPELAEYFPALWGCLLAGLRPVTLAEPAGYDRRSAVLDKLHAAWVAGARPCVLAGGSAVEGLRRLGALYGGDAPRVVDVGDCLAPHALEHPLDGGDVALLQQSSGTTGPSKLIQMTHRAVHALALAGRDVLGVEAPHRTVNWLPLDHVVGLVMFHLRDVVLGATSVHAPTAWVIGEPLRWLDLLERHEAQHTWAPNFGYRLAADALEHAGRSWDLQRVRTLVNGGEQCTLPVVERFLAATAPFGVRPHHMRLAWGMAETGTAMTSKPFDEPGVVRRAPGTAGVFLSVGGPDPGCELRVVDGTGSAVREGEVGRLSMRGERLTPGYVVDGVAQPVTDPDGWFDTGDLAFIEEGELVITGRAKDVIVIAGANVFAHEVEDAAAELPGVRDGAVAACGVPDAASGSEAIAVLYVAAAGAGREQTSAAIRAAVAQAVGIAPAIVVSVPDERFARTTSGKVQRALLRERLLAGELGPLGTSGPHEPEPHCDTAFAPCWARLRRTAPAGRRLPQPTLVLHAPGGTGARLAQELARGMLDAPHVALVGADAADRAIRPWVQEDWDLLREQLRARPPRSVVFLASYDADEREVAPSRSVCGTAYLGLARLLRSLDFAGPLVSVSRQLHRILPDEPLGSPLPALTAALALSIRAEAPTVDAWHLDLAGDAPATDAQALEAAVALRRGELELAWRDGALHVPCLHAIPLAGSATAPAQRSLAAGGRAAIATGGLGGVGVELLTTLLADGVDRLLVVGRTPLDEPAAAPRRDALARLAPLCREVRYRVAPAEDAAALRDAVEEAERDWSTPITLGLHAAGSYEEGLIETVEPATWAAQVAGKADGLVNLAAILQARDGAALIAISSVLTQIGAAASAAYVAANRFVEECCQALAARGTFDVRCIGWGMWRGVGISARARLEAHAVRRGMLALSAAEGRALTGWALRQPAGLRLLGLNGTHPRVRCRLDDGGARALEQVVVETSEGAADAAALPPLRDVSGNAVARRITLATAPPLPAPADAKRADDALTQVLGVFAELVDGPVPLDRTFAELGLGSIELVKAHALLERRCGRAIQRTLLFELPTVRLLAERLAADDTATGPAPRRAAHTADAVAIVGVALRFPGAHSADELWALLREGRSAVRRFSNEELIAAGVSEQLVRDPDFVPVTAALDDIERFAPEAFGMTPREAALTAPQQRLLLEVAHELLAVCGYEMRDEQTTVGVFAGTGMNLYALNTYLLSTLLGTTDVRDPVTALQVAIGNEPDFAAARLAYRLGLTGPAVSVQTACSTALTAVHLARQSLLAGDCDVAIAGAGAVHVPHPTGYLYREGSILSPAGVCRAFDARADGTVGGNGVAALLLKPLAAARADGDAIHAVLRGSAINNDGGAKAAFSAPSPQGQRAVVRRALATADVRADTIAYVQAHGTGTPIGDPIEVQALTTAFGASSERRGRCLLGSIKPNLGHLDSCAGLAGLITALLALRHEEAPPQINFEQPNPDLALEDGPFRIAREPTPLTRTPGEPLRASVSALGVGGTNVHVVLERVE